MSNFVVSARKYRPIRFNSVVGQAHIANTLKNAMRSNHLAHAFLFCGPRGVGKTTCARILAKVLNCEHPTADYEPCDECDSCKAFRENASLNVYELDAASNNSVEHIRALIEQVRFAPQRGKFKIYIIDEVHMLSQAAFNAFLKTLEEPPNYAIFILATTEKHKIIPTILSRCQIFDFNRIQVADMVAHLQHICQEEHITAEEEALHIIGQKADGALRDALSIFDRIVSFSGDKILYKDVIDNLNILDYDYYFKIVDALLAEDVAGLLMHFDNILKKGFDGDIFINGLAEHIRNLLVCQDATTLPLLEVSGNIRERYGQQARMSPKAFLLTSLSLLNDCDIHYKMARNKRLHTEIYLLKMAYIHRTLQLQQVPAGGNTEKKNPDPKLNTESSQVTEQPVQYQKEQALSFKEKLANKGSLLNKLAEEAKVEQEQEKLKAQEPALELNQANIDVLWQEHWQKMLSESSRVAYKTAKLSLENEVVVVKVVSTLAKDEIQRDAAWVGTFRQKFQRPTLAMRIELDEVAAQQLPKVNVVAKPVTDREKYVHFRDLNPLVAELQKRLQLVPPEAKK